MIYQYKTIPFIGKNSNLLDPNLIANQLNREINSNSIDGWEFYKINNVNIYVEAGCLPAMFGAKSYEKRFDMLVFRKGISSRNINELDCEPSSSNNQASNTEAERKLTNRTFKKDAVLNESEAILALEERGYTIIKTPKNIFMSNDKDYVVYKDKVSKDYSSAELINLANDNL